MTHWDGSFYHAIAHHLPNPIVVADLDGRIVFANPEVERLAGRGLVDRHLDDLVAPEHSAVVSAWFASLARGAAGGSVYLGALPVTWNGVDRWIELSGRDMLAVDGFRGAVIALRDVTAHRNELAALEYHASHDGLTGLLNRSAMHQNLEVLAASPEPSVVLMIDLDAFKLVNDMYGHSVGDEILVTLARRLEALLPEAVLARFGGDELVVAVPGVSEADGAALARRLCDALAEPYVVDAIDIVCTASIGVAVLDGSVEEALRRADTAVYVAKAEGRRQVVTYDGGTRSWARRRLDLVHEVDALRHELREVQAQASAHRFDARTDDGTGLPNRRKLFEDLAEAHGTSRSSGRPYAIAFLDLDHFGRLNHARGDDEGDRTLRDVAAVLEATARHGEVVYRKGGEELVVILDGADLAGALTAGERFRASLEAAALPHGGVEGWPVVTASVGVAVGSPTMPEEILRTAALCMLDAKARGRNRVSSTPIPLPVETG
jgi:diguanylate cyclase (GGDEF)-like protein/PAS domain S-box-containing protein